MMKVNIERRSINVPAACLAPGTVFHYTDEPIEGTHNLLMKINLLDRAVNLCTGEIVIASDQPYHIIRDVEFKGWV